MVLSLEPDTTSLSWYCKQAIPRLWPMRVRTNSQLSVLHTFNILAHLNTTRLHSPTMLLSIHSTVSLLPRLSTYNKINIDCSLKIYTTGRKPNAHNWACKILIAFEQVGHAVWWRCQKNDAGRREWSFLSARGGMYIHPLAYVCRRRRRNAKQ